MTVEIEIRNAHVDGTQPPQADFEILLRFVCDFVIRVAGIEIFREVEFPFIEFGAQVAAWLRTGTSSNFDFESMESSVPGLVYFHRTDSGGWNVGSMFPGSPGPIAVTTDELRQGIAAFLLEVPSTVDAFGVDVRRFLSQGS